MPVDAYIAALNQAAGNPADDPARTARAERAATLMPYSHSLKHGRSVTDFLRNGRASLRSPIMLGVAPSAARTFAGTADLVCFWLGPPRIPERQAVLVFDGEIDRSRADGTTTPWDSGGLFRIRGQHLAPAQRQALVQQRTMGAPDSRRALARSLYLRHATPSDYVRAVCTAVVDPDGIVLPTDPSSFTYEGRFPNEVLVYTRHLRYVAIRRDVIDPGLHGLRTWCAQQHVPCDVVGESRYVIEAAQSAVETLIQ